MERSSLAREINNGQIQPGTTDAIAVSERMAELRYAVRDIVVVAREAQRAGRELLYLNIGDPNLFDFRTPAHLVDAITRALRDNHTSYAPSEGIPSALDAIRRDAESKGMRWVRDVFVGHGSSECIEIAFSALLNAGDNILTPSPGYPLFSAVLAKLNCEENAYALDEDNGWQPDLEDIERRITPRTRGIVVINPNNPTGSVCTRKTLEAILEIAARHRLVVFADEIYDRLLLDGAPCALASLRGDLPIFTFNGLSKAFLSPGLRLGWCISSGPEAVVRDYIEAMHKILRTRLCANHAVQYAVAPALDGDKAHIEETKQKLRARRAIVIEMLRDVPQISLVAPEAAFYAFPRLNIKDTDENFVKRLIRETGVVVVHGSGFGARPATPHVRIVFLPSDAVLRRALTAFVQMVQKAAA